ncbi:lasso peptide isopeptide bond-forming cyclase [Methanobacterium sp.]|uniref:lasso peptide isopeptide bond-forming cyclase n=1 Tax=Methanobacterium sp. TaxID=2164 RepID=UPI003C7116BC
MSAITGIFLNHGCSISSNLIKQMNDSLSYRGPDGSSIWVEGPAAFGHQMLHTTPESLNEKLPLFKENESLAITADARIDNRDELIKNLEIEESKEEITDSEIILNAYKKWGEKCPEKLLGDFAFVIWDKKKESLFCARDHMGVKPFYYYLSDDGFYFATEIKALFCIPEISPKINDVKIADYLISMHEDRRSTFFQNIFRLPAAHTLTIDFKDNDLNQYWSLDPSYELSLDSDEEYAKRFHDIFQEAVKCRLRSSYPVGSELSGGLDSSSVTCVAQEVLLKDKNKLKTFSVIFEDLPDCDESYYSKIVSKWCGADSHFIKSDGINPFEVMDSPSWPNERPQLSHSMYVFWFLYKKVQKEGVRVILNGFEGDATVGKGYGLLSELARKRKFKSVLRELKNASKYSGNSLYKTFFYEIGSVYAPETLKRIWKYFKKDFTYRQDERKVINKDFAKKTNISKRYEIMDEYLKNKGKGVRENHFYELNSGFYQMIFEEFDQIASAFSIEFRYPFMDKRLLEFCLALPPEQQLCEGWDRIIMRRSMEGIIPPEIQYRHDKKFFDSNFNLGLLKYGKKELKHILNQENKYITKYVDMDVIKELYSYFESYNNVDMGNEPYMLWKVANLYLWLHKHDLKSEN